MKKNKTKKALASLAIAGMAISLVPFNALADTTNYTTTRISGSDRIETAVKVADKFGTADTAILAPSANANLVDALAAAPLAGKNTPILLTENNNLNDSTKAELTKLGVKNVYVVGAISQSVVDQLTAMGLKPTVLKGADRIGTAAQVSAKLVNPAGSFVVGYGALADALSVASYAAANNYSILVANPDGSIPASESAYMGSKVYVVGGPTLVSDIPGATRLAGADRFATNQAVLNALSYAYKNVYVANGMNGHLVDSLVASSLAASTSAPIVLTDGNTAVAADTVHAKLDPSAVVTALGGSTVVPQSVLDSIVKNKVIPPVVVPVKMGSISVTGQKVGTGSTDKPAVAVVNNQVTVGTTITGTGATNASITYLVTTSDNITAKDANGNTLVDTTLNSPVIIGNNTFKASYTVPADPNGNVKATFTSTATSQETFNVVIEAPFSDAGKPVQSDVASIEWGAPGTMVLSPVYKSSNPDDLNYSTGSKPTTGLVPVVATLLPADGSTTATTGQAVKFTMTNTGSSDSANAYFTDQSGTSMVASGASVGKGASSQNITYVVNTDQNGQALTYINANLPSNNSVADLGATMNVSVQAQLVNGGGSSTAGYYQWKAVAQPSKVANVTPSSMLNPTGLENGGVVVNDSAETATSGSVMTISGTLEDAAGNPVPNATVAIQDYNVTGGESSNNVQNDAYIAADGTTQLFSAIAYPMVTTDSNGQWSIKVTANIPVTQSIKDSITKYYAFYVPPTIAISNGQSLPTSVTPLNFVGNSNSGNFVDLVWQQGQTAQTVGASHTSLLPNYSSLSAVPQTMSFTNVVGNHEEMYAAAYNQTGTIIAPASGNQFDRYALTFDINCPSGIHFEQLGSNTLGTFADGTGIARIVATYNQITGLVINTMYYANGTVYYQSATNPDGTTNANAVTPANFDPTIFADAYDGSGQLHFYLNSDTSNAVKTSGTAGSVTVNVNAYSNTNDTGKIDTTHAQGSASGTINATFTGANSISSLGVASDASGFYDYVPLKEGNAAPPSTLTVAGTAIPGGNSYTSQKNASFVAAPFNSYPALSTVPSQGLTMNLNADKSGVVTNVDGYVLSSNPNNVTYNVNSLGEVSVNNVKLWQAVGGYRVVGYMPGANNNTFVLVEQNTTDLTKFIGVSVTTVGSSGSTVSNWTVPQASLAQNYEEFLGFTVDGTGALQPMVASYYSANTSFAPAVPLTSGTALTAGTFTPVEAATAYASDKYAESPTITISNSLNSQTATVTTNFTASSGGLVAAKTSPASVNSVLGGSQNITITAQDSFGNPISNQVMYLGTGSTTQGLWITQVNGTTIQSSVNMGTTASTSMQTVNTPIPLFSVGNKPAYDSASVTGVTAYHLQSTPVVALTTGVDGTVSITLVDGNVTFVANTATTINTNSYAVDPGTPISGQPLVIYSDNTMSHKVGQVMVNWNNNSNVVNVTGVSLNAGTMSLTAGGATGTLTATVAPTNATNTGVNWSTSNAGVATVVNGVVTPVAAGTAVITATTADGGKTAACNVTVGSGTQQDVVTVTTAASPTGFGSLITVNVTSANTLATATQYQVFKAGAAISSKAAIGSTTTLFPAQTAGTQVQVEFFNAAGTQVGATQTETL